MYSLKSLFAAGCLLLSAASNATTIINVSPNLQQANIGDTVSVNLTISGVNTGAVPALGAYDISLSFDPSLLSFEVATFGSQLDIHGLGDVQTVTPSTGSVEIFEVSLYSANDLTMLQKSSFTLGNIWFQTLAAGTSALTLSVNALADAMEIPQSLIPRTGASTYHPCLSLMAFNLLQPDCYFLAYLDIPVHAPRPLCATSKFLD